MTTGVTTLHPHTPLKWHKNVWITTSHTAKMMNNIFNCQYIEHFLIKSCSYQRPTELFPWCWFDVFLHGMRCCLDRGWISLLSPSCDVSNKNDLDTRKRPPRSKKIFAQQGLTKTERKSHSGGHKWVTNQLIRVSQSAKSSRDTSACWNI